MEQKYMIIISFDAVSSDDLEILKTLPNFKTLIEKGSLIENVQSIYPTLTYPAHATIVTGKYPKNHGIIDNTKFKLNDLNPNWYWYRKDLKGDTLYDKAKEKGYTTCSILWPVTGRSSITYNLPEIFPTKSYHNQILMSAYSGSLKYQLELNKMFGNIRKGTTQPALDDFVLECVKHTIYKYTPNLMLIHFTDVDTNRHNYGYGSKEANDALLRHDNRLGEIIKALKNKNIYNNSTIVALGDHSALDVSKSIRLNKLFLDNNLIKVNDKGKIIDYKVISKSLDGSCYIYFKDKSCIDNVKNLLDEYKKQNIIDFILDNKRIKIAGGDTNADLMVEGALGYYFIDDLNGDIIENIETKSIGKVKHMYKATHGYYPAKDNYGTFFVGCGLGFKEGITIPNGKIINHAPTLAKILNISLENIDGEAVDEILEL